MEWVSSGHTSGTRGLTDMATASAWHARLAATLHKAYTRLPCLTAIRGRPTAVVKGPHNKYLAIPVTGDVRERYSLFNSIANSEWNGYLLFAIEFNGE